MGYSRLFVLFGLCLAVGFATIGCNSSSSDDKEEGGETAESSSSSSTPKSPPSSSSSSSEPAAPAPTMTGNWKGRFETGDIFTLKLQEDGDIFTGTYKSAAGEGRVTGSTSGDKVKMTIAMILDPAAVAQFSGTVNKERTSMSGTASAAGDGGGTGTWSATK